MSPVDDSYRTGARPNKEPHIAVEPNAAATLALARRMIVRAQAADVEIALVDGQGGVTFVEAEREEEL